MREFNIINNICSLHIYEAEIHQIHQKEPICHNIVFVSIINNLIENGQAQIIDNNLVFDIDILYNILDSDDLVGLDIPKFTKLILYVKAKNTHNLNSFSFEYEFYDYYPHGNKAPAIVDNGILITENRRSLLTKNQYEIIELINRHTALNPDTKTQEVNLVYLSQIKEYSKTTSVILDSYLANEDVVVSKRLSLNITEEKGEPKLSPSIDKSIDESFQRNFKVYPSVKKVYPAQENDSLKRKRVILDDKQVESLQTVKVINKSGDKCQIIAVIDNPEEYFDPEVIDVSEFYSDRVIEIGVYKPKYSKFITPYKSEWLPGIAINYKNNGIDQIVITDQKELDDLTSAIELAEKEDKKIVSFEDHTIPLDSAKVLQKLAKAQFKSKTPLTEFEGEKLSQKRVLIIKDNDDELSFQSTDKDSLNEVAPNQLEHKLFPVSNLRKDIALKTHQQEGVAWMQNLYSQGFDGCLLADDMGLGKTLQVLYFMEWLGQQSESVHQDKPILIVAPISLLENWENEYRRFFDNHSYSVFPFYGTMGYLKNKLDGRLHSLMSKRQIVLTNYESLRTYQLTLCAVDFHLVVLDEAQRIKTPGTLVTNAAKALKTIFRIAMSGTPVENSLMDLWCITDFAVPGLLGSAKVFAKKYQTPLKEQAKSIVKLGEQLRNDIGILLKRRLKTDVAKDLPAKWKSNDKNSFSKFDNIELVCEMPDIQLQYYKEAMMVIQNSDKSNMLEYINRIKAISDHPYLGSDNFLNIPSGDLINSSAKMRITMGLIDRVQKADEKVIIFAERRDVQKMLQKVINERYGLYASIINGDTPSLSLQNARKTCLSRQETINKFSDLKGFNVLILSPVAAGVGLNIVAANHVIHYSRHWNPAKEEQATDRAYRIGQKKDVLVYYPMAISSEFRSFDVLLNDLLERKLSLAAHTLFPTEQVEVSLSDLYLSLTNK